MGVHGHQSDHPDRLNRRGRALLGTASLRLFQQILSVVPGRVQQLLTRPKGKPASAREEFIEFSGTAREGSRHTHFSTGYPQACPWQEAALSCEAVIVPFPQHVVLPL